MVRHERGSCPCRRCALPSEVPVVAIPSCKGRLRGLALTRVRTVLRGEAKLLTSLPTRNPCTPLRGDRCLRHCVVISPLVSYGGERSTPLRVKPLLRRTFACSSLHDGNLLIGCRHRSKRDRFTTVTSAGGGAPTDQSRCRGGWTRLVVHETVRGFAPSSIAPIGSRCICGRGCSSGTHTPGIGEAAKCRALDGLSRRGGAVIAGR